MFKEQKRQEDMKKLITNESDPIESNKTVLFYMINLITMILMCILIVGVIIIYLVIVIEGSLYVNPIILVHLTIPAFVLALNLYTIMLEDKEELKFFKKGYGFFLMNFAFLISVLALFISIALKYFD